MKGCRWASVDKQIAVSPSSPGDSFALAGIASFLVALGENGVQAELQGLEVLADSLFHPEASSYPTAMTTELLILYFSVCHLLPYSCTLHFDVYL